MKTCDICINPLGFMKFRYEGGYLCKSCYEKASRHCVETIRHKTLEELLAICNNEDETSVHDETFEVSRRVANYILFDDHHKKICIPNNRSIIKTYQKPQIYNYADIQKVALEAEPKMSFEELLKLEVSKESQVIHFLRIKIMLRSQNEPCMVPVVTTPVRSTSYAFKRSFTFSKRILTALEKLVQSSPK